MKNEYGQYKDPKLEKLRVRIMGKNAAKRIARPELKKEMHIRKMVKKLGSSSIRERNKEKARLYQRINWYKKHDKRITARSAYKVYRDKINNSQTLFENSLILKWVIGIVLLMSILTFNATGEINLWTQITDQVHETETEVIYTDQYKLMVLEERGTISKITECAKAFSYFGQDNAWIKIINNISGVNGTGAIELIGNILFMPINIITDIATLFINIFNAWNEKELIHPISFKYSSSLKSAMNSMLLPPWTTKWIIGIG